ncbi:PREDICTED: uncharacterized protein LOC18606172 [Theobroma cacao]|uniref:Uncharacterized protein LOC18606172 n=1 Tax=Theobroma cacao TaxID=3641 RepID=A0AB32VG01_THECC|nr:PREDICTED: uncharacterized protein LOC18606172 [Theobroma cacao]XP_017973391.1 PREDICTED: uncharacterized protein LOC18606172 [Theobroma cacao]
MEPDDPFGWITELCQVSSSEESRLRRCSYFGQSDSDDSDSKQQNPLDILVAAVGITIVTPPESQQDEPENDTNTLPEDQEIFHTPPESRATSISTSVGNCNDVRMIGDDLDHDGETVVVDADSAASRRAVDLGSDTDLGFSEVEVDSTQRIEANSKPDGAFGRKSEEIRVSRRGFSPNGQLSTESPSKKLKSLDFESPSVRLGTSKGGNTDEILKSLEKWNFKTVSLSPRASSELERENQQNYEANEVGEGSVRERRLDMPTDVTESEERIMDSKKNDSEGNDGETRLDFSTEDIDFHPEKGNAESENENGEGNSGRNNKSVEDIDQFRFTGGNGSNSREMKGKTDKKRALPSWANGRMGADERVEDNEREPVQADTDSETLSEDVEDSESLSEDFEEMTLLNVLMELAKACEEDRSLECLSLLEVAERKGI